MEKYFRYHFELKHDQGTFFVSTVSYNKEKATEALMKNEGCPRCAITYIRTSNVNI